MGDELKTFFYNPEFFFDHPEFFFDHPEFFLTQNVQPQSFREILIIRQIGGEQSAGIARDRAHADHTSARAVIDPIPICRSR